MIVADTFAHFETVLFALWLQIFKALGGCIVHFAFFFFPMLAFLLGSNSVPDELKAPAQTPERTKLSYSWFGDATSKPGMMPHSDITLQIPSTSGLPWFPLLTEQLWLLPKLG